MEKAARAFGPAHAAEVAKTKDYVLTALRDVGAVERTRAQGRLIGYEVDGEKTGLDINITEEAKAMPSHLPAPYRILSGAPAVKLSPTSVTEHRFGRHQIRDQRAERDCAVQTTSARRGSPAGYLAYHPEAGRVPGRQPAPGGR